MSIVFALKKYDYSTCCLYCGSENTKTIQKKFFILHLKKCFDCLLMFRFPKDILESSIDRYTKSYMVEDITTTPPPEDVLNNLKITNFIGSPKDFSKRVEIIKKYSSGKKLFEFGSSWGYFLYQAKNAGFDVLGFELGEIRKEYGVKNLDVNIISDYKLIPESYFDVIYSCHVVEHLPNLRDVINLFVKCLKKDGVIIIECPNASSDEANKKGVYWPPMINEFHLSAISPEFLIKCFRDLGFKTVISTDWDELILKNALFEDQEILDLSRSSITFIAKRESFK